MKYLIYLAWLAILTAGVEWANAGDTWAVASIASYHVNADRDYNTHNLGAGIERTDGAISYMGGEYRNSVDRTSVYALAGWTPLSLGPLRFGAAAGLVNGYPGMDNGRVGPVAVGLVRIEGERVGANLIIIPRVPQKTPWTIGLQVKFKL